MTPTYYNRVRPYGDCPQQAIDFMAHSQAGWYSIVRDSGHNIVAGPYDTPLAAIQATERDYPITCIARVLDQPYIED